MSARLTSLSTQVLGSVLGIRDELTPHDIDQPYSEMATAFATAAAVSTGSGQRELALLRLAALACAEVERIRGERKAKGHTLSERPCFACNGELGPCRQREAVRHD